jgi:hypothetical protein
MQIAFEGRFVDHSQYLDAWFENLKLTGSIVLVMHDWVRLWDAIGLRALAAFCEGQRVLDENFLVETVLPRNVIRNLAPMKR